MNVFVRAVITGFGYSLGASLYKKISKRLEGEEASDDGERAAAPAHPVAADKRADDVPGEPGDSDSPDADHPAEPND